MELNTLHTKHGYHSYYIFVPVTNQIKYQEMLFFIMLLVK
jgi:hypothetical protein